MVYTMDMIYLHCWHWLELKPLTLFSLSLCMNTLFYSILTAWVVNSCNTNGCDWTGRMDGSYPFNCYDCWSTCGAKNNQNNSNCLIPSDSPSLRALKWRSLWEDEDWWLLAGCLDARGDLSGRRLPGLGESGRKSNQKIGAAASDD